MKSRGHIITIGFFVDFMKSTKIGGSKGLRKQELKWQQKSNKTGKDLHEE